MTQQVLEISQLVSASGNAYEVSSLKQNQLQYVDRDYQFDYIPDELAGALHIKTFGNDKLISENDLCVSFRVNCDVDLYVLYADKFPSLPMWLQEYERKRLNVTRLDSTPNNLKGYFGLYKKTFTKGLIELKGCSPQKMLEQDWFVKSLGYTYCMYTFVIVEKN